MQRTAQLSNAGSWGMLPGAQEQHSSSGTAAAAQQQRHSSSCRAAAQQWHSSGTLTQPAHRPHLEALQQLGVVLHVARGVVVSRHVHKHGGGIRAALACSARGPAAVVGTALHGSCGLLQLTPHGQRLQHAGASGTGAHNCTCTLASAALAAHHT